MMALCVQAGEPDRVLAPDGTTFTWVSWWNNGDTPQLVDNITLYKNGEATDYKCSPGVVQPGASGLCAGPTGGQHDGYSAHAHYWNWSDGDFDTQWLTKYSAARDIWDMIGDD